AHQEHLRRRRVLRRGTLRLGAHAHRGARQHDPRPAHGRRALPARDGEPRPPRDGRREARGGAAMSTVLYDAPGPKAKRRARIITAVVLVLLAAAVALLVIAFVSPRTSVNGTPLRPLADPSLWAIL